MPYLNDNVYDNGLAWARTNGTRIDICSAEPANYAGVAGVSLGSKSGIALTAPADGPVDGRQVTTPAITDGAATADGTATHYAITDGAGVLVTAGPLAASQAVTSGNSFTLGSIRVTLRDATVV